MNPKQHPEIALPQNEAQHLLKRKTRRSLLVGGLAAFGGVGFYEWVTKAADDNGVPWPQRRVLDWNGRLAHAYLSDYRQMPAVSPEKVGGVKPNGDYGLSDEVSIADWQVRVEVEEGDAVRTLSIADFKAMPKTELTTRFCCIEGWSGIARWGGLRFSEFTKTIFPAGQKVPSYVYLATPDEAYYVGLDMKSALHPQTLLVYEQNGKPLEVRRGAPLRLAIPVKYGIKNIKQIGLIRYTDTRPGDYWAEQGYDWFSGI